MSSPLGVSETLELLNRLKGAVGDFAVREQRLDHSLRLKQAQEANQYEEAVAREKVRVAEATEKVEAAFRARQELLESRYVKRRARINKAHQGSRKMALERIELDEGRQKYIVQKGLLDTERNRKAELAANDGRHEEFKGALAQHRQAFTELEQAAQGACRAYTPFLQTLAEPGPVAEPDVARDEYQLLEEISQLYTQTTEHLEHFRKLFAPAFFKVVPVWLLVPLLIGLHAGLVPALGYFQVRSVTWLHAAMSLVVLLGLAIAAYLLGRRKGTPLVATIATSLERARKLHDVCLQKSTARHQQEIERIEGEARSRARELNQQWDKAVAEAGERRESWPKLMDQKVTIVAARHEYYGRQRLERLEQDHAAALARVQEECEARQGPLAETHARNTAQFTADHQAQWQALEAEWKGRLQPVFRDIEVACAGGAPFLEWRPELWTNWTPPETFTNAVKFAHLEVDVDQVCDALPKDPRLALPGPARFSLPLLLTYPREGSILLETSKHGSEAAAGALNNIILRLLSQAPPGRMNFTIIDPVKLGQNFAGVMHLADYEENLINNRIWTQTTEIEQRLADLNEHMEKVIQMYLRNEYATIAEYNEQAGKIAEKYHFLVIADFPVNFSETAVRRLVNIAASGARCGVYTLIHWDRRQVLPPEFVVDELKKNDVCVACPGNTFMLAGQPLTGTRLVLEAPPAPDLATEFLHKVGVMGKDSNRVEVPFVQVSPPPEELWSVETTEELRVPIGRTGATKLQYLAIGKGTRQHALFAGKTGSGKSTLFHVIITNLAMWCSPEQVEFYLVDFKKGVEFKCYASRRLPHARVVAIESDREFGLSVLQRLDEELKRRGDMFRHLGVQDVAGYKRAGGTEPIPRTLLIIDEFQEFFVEDDRVSQGAAVLLDRIVRQGRAFGIHVLLGSQTLGGAYTLARTTIGQMVIRVALQCNEADAYLIMDENNPAPRLLSRPGEGIYNDMAGMLEGNSPFQTVWLPDEEREGCLDRVRVLAEQQGLRRPAPFVFEGNAPADVRENAGLRALLETVPSQTPPAGRIWLGAPNAIKGPTEGVFHRQSGNNLLMVGQRDEATLAIMSVAMISLAAQYPRGAARFVLVDSTAPGSPPRELLERVTAAIPHEITVAKSGDLAEVLGGLATELKRRADDEHGGDAPATFLFIYGLQNFKKLRQEDEFSFSSGDSDGAANPSAVLGELISGGAALGIHVFAACDTYNNVNRFLGRKALSEFEMRVLFQMSANDSASLIDNPKASNLGLHRALFFNEHEGYLETFRPYALPAGEWIDEVARQLRQRPA